MKREVCLGTGFNCSRLRSKRVNTQFLTLLGRTIWVSLYPYEGADGGAIGYRLILPRGTVG